jgi:adenylate cyclase class 2
MKDEEKAMKYEVEQKFSVADQEALEARLVEMGGQIGRVRVESDQYYNHPAHDFSVTDEALRIRRREGEAYITYKGPKIDPTTKTRRELELSLAGAPAGQWAELLEALGFRSVAEVRKQRRKVLLDWQNFHVEISLDEVERVGRYVELELVVEEEELPAAQACLAALAECLQLRGGERRSYLELLLERGEGGG